MTLVEQLVPLVFVAAFLAGGYYLTTAVHEGAHALVALIVGLRVTKVRISATGDGQTVVVPKGRALPARMLAMTLAGPLGSLAFGVALLLLAQRPVPELVSDLLLMVGWYALLSGLLNLVPSRLRRGRTTDGWNVLAWIFRPRVTTARLCADPGQLARIVATTTDPQVLLAAVKRRVGIDPMGYTELIADADRLLAVARDERTARARAAAIAQWLSLHFGFSYLHMTIALGQPVDRANREEIVETAELAVRLNPTSRPARIGLAVARLLDNRPAEALGLLANFRSTTPAQHGVVIRLFAIALIYLGNRARADALLASLTQPADTQLRKVLAKLRDGTELPPLVRADPGPGQSSAPAMAVRLPEGSTEDRP